MEWPSELVRTLFLGDDAASRSRRERFSRVVRRGVRHHGDFSGMDFAGEGFYAVGRSIQELLNIPDVFLSVRTCDWGKLQQAALMARPEVETHGACVFGDILDRLPANARGFIAAMTPGDAEDNDKSLEEVAQAHREVEQWLIANHQFCFPTDAMSWCTSHGCYCPVSRPEVADETAFRQPTKRRKCATPWYRRRQERPPLVLNTASTVCVAWSKAGLREGSAHKEDVSHAVWLAERFARASEEAVYFHECVCEYPIEKQSNVLEKTHSVLTLPNVKPDMFGWPLRRPRRFSAGLSKSLVKWVGPSDYITDFNKLFGRRLGVGADALLCAGTDDLVDEYMEVSAHVQRQRGRASVAVSRDTVRTFAGLESILALGYRERLSAWVARALGEEVQGNALFADIKDNPRRGKVAPNIFPTVLKKSMIVSLTDQRLVHSKEIMTAMGLRLFPAHDGDRCSPLLSFLDGCSRFERMTLCGNGVHAPTYLAWILYVLSNIVCLDDCEEPARSLPTMVPEYSSDDSDEDSVENTKREGVAEEDIEESAGGSGQEEAEDAASSGPRRALAEESSHDASSSERRALGLSSAGESDDAASDDPTMGGLFQFGDDFVFPVGDWA